MPKTGVPSHTLYLGEPVWDWLTQEKEVRGLGSVSDVVTALVEDARAHQAGTAVQETAAPALQEMLTQQGAQVVQQTAEALAPVLESIVLEATQARMLATEQISYLYDKDQLVCPYCRKRYMDYQGAVTFAQERAQVVLQKAKDALAAGRRPRLRVW